MKFLSPVNENASQGVGSASHKERNKKTLKSGAGILAVGGIVAKVLGALYRIPLTNVLGAEGMGLYQLVFPVYAFFMILSTVGIPTALSRIVAEERARGGEAKKYLFACMLTLLTLSTVGAALVFVLAKQIATIQGNALAYKGFWIIAPSLVFVGAIAGFRGWFQGEMYMIPTAVSNILEQIVKLGVGLSLSIVFMKRGVVYAVYGALVGVTISEFVTLVYMFLTYAVRSRRMPRERLRITKAEGASVFRVAFPIAIVSVLLPLANFFDSIIIVNMLRLFGLSKAVATSQYGLLSGPVNSLVNVPVVITLALAIAIVPSVSASRVERDVDAILKKSRISIKLTYLLGIPFAIFFVVFAEKLVGAIYPRLGEEQLRLTANLLRICAFNVVTLSSMQIYVSLIQAVDKTKTAVLSLVCAIIIKTILQITLTRFMGVLGAAIASASMGAIALILLVINYFKICGLHLEKNVGKNLISGVIMGITGVTAVTAISNDILAIVVGAVVTGCVYLWTVFLFGLVGQEEIEFLPLKGLLGKIHRIVRFWEYKDVGF